MASISINRLSCGMPLLVEEISGVRSAAISLAIPAGNAEDPVERLGMATMWSEMLLRGCGGRDSRQDADHADTLGITRAASNGSYYLSISAAFLAERLPEVMDLVTDMIFRPLFDLESVEPARELALQSLEALKDDPQERCLTAARERHYRTPFDRSGLGTVDGLTAITHADLVSGWQRKCTPQRAILGVAGAVRCAEVLDLSERAFDGWTGLSPDFPIGPPPSRGYQHITDQSNQVQIVLLHDGPPENQRNDRDALLEKIVISVLSGGMSGRLFTEVREKRGLCYSVSASYRGDRTYGVCLAYVGTTPERAQTSLDVLQEQLEHINTPAGRVTPEEFARAIVGMKTAVVFSGESTSARAAALVTDQHRLDAPRSLDQLTSMIDSVTLDEVNAYLSRRRLGTFTIQTLGPDPLKA